MTHKVLRSLLLAGAVACCAGLAVWFAGARLGWHLVPNARAISNTPPTVWIDNPTGSVGGTVLINGWAIDNATDIDNAISHVDVAIDGVNIGTATYNVWRPDVCVVYPGRQGCPNVGYTYTWNSASVPNGYHTITVTAYDTDFIPHSASKSMTINVQNGANQCLLPVYHPNTSGFSKSPTGPTSHSIVLSAGTGFYAFADFGLIADSIWFDTTLGVPCTWAGDPNIKQPPNTPGWNGTAAVYYCTAPNLATNYIFIAATHTGTTSNTCADSAVIGTMYVHSSSTSASLPQVWLDRPPPETSVASVVNIFGWAIDDDTPISRVDIAIDGKFLGTAETTYRPDVCVYYGNRPGCPDVGYILPWDTTGYSVGYHTITVTATDKDAPTPQTIVQSYVTKLSLRPTPDYVPPVISFPNFTAANNQLTFTWTTNEPATTEVYLRSSNPSLGAINHTNTSLVTDHSITITPIPNGTYYYQLRSVDEGGNMTVTPFAASTVQ